MAYQKFTPFNFVALLLIIVGFFFGVNSGAMGFGWIVTFYFLPFAFFIVMADLFVQGVCENKLKPIFYIEFVLIICFVVCFFTNKIQLINL